MSDVAERPVDLIHLARYTGGERATNAEILELFVSQSAELMRKLQAVVETRDGDSWRHIMHSLKGAARGVGAFALAQVAAEAEPLDPAIQHAQTMAALQSLRTRTEAVHEFVNSYLAAA